jgi:dTMP kinase
MFVVFEGGEGAGKTTVIELVAGRLRSAGRDVVVTREPGGTEAGEQVRALLHLPLTPWAETFAFLTARAQVVEEVIQPAMARGATVLCDRFEASTFAYQGHARGLNLDALRAANESAAGGLHPDLTAWLDIDPVIGLARKHGEQEAIVIGREDLDFHRRVRAGYLAQFEVARPASWLRLDATLPPETVAAAVLDAIRQRLSQIA